MMLKNLILVEILGIINYSVTQVNCQHRVKLVNDYEQEHRNEFPKKVIFPTVQHGRHKRSIEHTRDENGLHVTNLILTYRHLDKDVIIDLQLNDHLIPDGHFISYQTQDGGKIVKILNKTEVDLCQYHGTIRGNHNSRVAVSTCNGINGIVIDGRYSYHIQSGPDNKINSEHFLFEHTNTDVNSGCGNANTSGGNFTSNIKLRHKRAASTSDNSFRMPYNSNEDSLYVELVVVVEYNLYVNLSRDISKVGGYVKDLVNIVNSNYVPLNIFIALTGVVVWTERNEIEITELANDTVNEFVKYREETLVNEHPSDNAHLLAFKKFNDGVVGMAYIGTMCSTTLSGSLTTVYESHIGEAANIMSHEIGHNFGLKHVDPNKCKCIAPGCLMGNSSSSNNPKHWSSCSLEHFSLLIRADSKQIQCLKNKPTKLIASNSCGNGFVDPGEECDCGLSKNCNTTCCNPKTCMLGPNAICATGKCCDLTVCQLKTAGFECRKPKGDCDLPEYCNGDSEYCPNDVFKRDTEICGLGQAYCYIGKCQSQLDSLECAKCGKNEICIDQKCESIEILRARGIGIECPENCNGNGICNNQGRCHCALGFAPPTCNSYGAGGSIDSGPLLNIEVLLASRIYFIVIFIVFLSATIFGGIYWCNNKTIPSPIGEVKKVYIAPKYIGRREEKPKKVSNVSNIAITIQNARSRLRQTDGPAWVV